MFFEISDIAEDKIIRDKNYLEVIKFIISFFLFFFLHILLETVKLFIIQIKRISSDNGARIFLK